ncbi:hypothetical protein Taro_045531, partial [Colocasia esculenta]|nr:hypothetical protein [Colocasia esculenta]
MRFIVSLMIPFSRRNVTRQKELREMARRKAAIDWRAEVVWFDIYSQRRLMRDACDSAYSSFCTNQRKEKSLRLQNTLCLSYWHLNVYFV